MYLSLIFGVAMKFSKMFQFSALILLLLQFGCGGGAESRHVFELRAK